MEGIARISTTNPVGAEGADESVTRRVQAAAEKVWAKGSLLDQATREARWGAVDNLVVAIVSIQTGAYYFIDKQSGRFFRTDSPRSRKIVSDTPRGVIAPDRDWLKTLLTAVIPDGEAVLVRYDMIPKAPPASSPSGSPQPVPGPAAPVPLRLPAPLKIETKERRIVMVEHDRWLDVGIHQLVPLLRAAGVEVPDAVKLSVTDQGYLRVLWTEAGDETVEES